MMGKEVESFTVEANIGSDKARKSSDGRYVSTPLPDEILELGFSEGDTVFLDLESESVDGEEVDYIRGSSESIGRHSLTIRRRSDFSPELFVRIPIEYTFHREGQSFHGLDRDDDLVVEVDHTGNEFRIYRGEEYPIRLKQLSTDNVFPEMKAPGIAGLGVTVLNQLLVEEYAEITGVPSRVSAGEEFEVGVPVQLPGLEKIVLQKREQGEPGFTDVETINEVAENEEVVEDVSVSLSERGVFEFRVWVEYRDGSEGSEVQEVEVV